MNYNLLFSWVATGQDAPDMWIWASGRLHQGHRSSTITIILCILIFEFSWSCAYPSRSISRHYIYNQKLWVKLISFPIISIDIINDFEFIHSLHKVFKRPFMLILSVYLYDTMHLHISAGLAFFTPQNKRRYSKFEFITVSPPPHVKLYNCTPLPECIISIPALFNPTM